MPKMTDTQGNEYEIVAAGVSALEALGWTRVDESKDEEQTESKDEEQTESKDEEQTESRPPARKVVRRTTSKTK